MKHCKDCRKTPDEVPFPRHPGYKDGWGNRCKSCKCAWQREHYRRTGGSEYTKRKAKDPEYLRRKELKKFGLTIEEYDELLEKQNGLCAICKKEPLIIRRLAVDHCHITGQVRGLLCSNCNIGLGYFKDSTQFLAEAIEYLNRSRARGVMAAALV